MMKRNYPIHRLLNKPYLVRRMVSCSVELLEFDIHLLYKDNIKSQTLADFLLEFSSPSSEEAPHVWILYMDDP